MNCSSSGEHPCEDLLRHAEPSEEKILKLIEVANLQIKRGDLGRANHANKMAHSMCVGEFIKYRGIIQEQQQVLLNEEVKWTINKIENASKTDQNRNETALLRQAVGLTKKQRKKSMMNPRPRIRLTPPNKNISAQMSGSFTCHANHHHCCGEHRNNSFRSTDDTISIDTESEPASTPTELKKENIQAFDKNQMIVLKKATKAELKTLEDNAKASASKLAQLRRKRDTLVKNQEYYRTLTKIRQETKKIEKEIQEKKEDYALLLAKQEKCRFQRIQQMKADQDYLGKLMMEEEKLTKKLQEFRERDLEMNRELEDLETESKAAVGKFLLKLERERELICLRLKQLYKRTFSVKDASYAIVPGLQKNLENVLVEIAGQESSIKKGTDFMSLPSIKVPPLQPFECSAEIF
ncbi:hypothetical protein FO519_005470 [Halicephalobus sp. NKZ332]|nr:hypothetical protein FO519_005470 [Halicephalobus sp. NKZ332]